VPPKKFQLLCLSLVISFSETRKSILLLYYTLNSQSMQKLASLHDKYTLIYQKTYLITVKLFWGTPVIILNNQNQWTKAKSDEESKVQTQLSLFLMPMTLLQEVQVWTTSLQSLMQKGIRHTPKQNQPTARQRPPTAIQVRSPFSYRV